jgi:hypothetical protein
VDADPDLETFLPQWTDERISANDRFLEDRDQAYMAKDERPRNYGG